MSHNSLSKQLEFRMCFNCRLHYFHWMGMYQLIKYPVSVLCSVVFLQRPFFLFAYISAHIFFIAHCSIAKWMFTFPRISLCGLLLLGLIYLFSVSKVGLQKAKCFWIFVDGCCIHVCTIETKLRRFIGKCQQMVHEFCHLYISGSFQNCLHVACVRFDRSLTNKQNSYLHVLYLQLITHYM